jgi:hypothetical protein
MRTTLAMAALVLLLGFQSLSSAQWSDRKVTVRGMFGDRVMADTLKPRPSKFGGTLEFGPSGNFLGRTPESRARMFNPISTTPRVWGSVVAPSPLPRPVVAAELIPEFQPLPPIPRYEAIQRMKSVPGEPIPPKSDVWIRGPSRTNDGGPAAPSPRAGRPSVGSGAAYALPLSNQYAVGFGDDVPGPIRQVSQRFYVASRIEDRLQRVLGTRARSPISVSLVNGTATVRGRVSTQNDRQLIGNLVMFEPGIRVVDNQVSIESPNLLSGGPER